MGEYRNHKTVYQAGGDTGFISLVMLIPDESIGLVMMCNFDGGGNVLRAIINASWIRLWDLSPNQSSLNRRNGAIEN